MTRSFFMMQFFDNLTISDDVTDLVGRDMGSVEDKKLFICIFIVMRT